MSLPPSLLPLSRPSELDEGRRSRVDRDDGEGGGNGDFIPLDSGQSPRLAILNRASHPSQDMVESCGKKSSLPFNYLVRGLDVMPGNG